nr:hypothetical protein [Tanacetum cinerariifolium]
MNYDKDPEFADILGTSVDDPAKARLDTPYPAAAVWALLLLLVCKIEERMRKKRDKIIQSKTGSATPMQVIFNKFDFNSSFIWIEFYHAPLDKDIKMVCDTIRSWHIYSWTSWRVQFYEHARANIEPTTFYNISDLEIQDNIARIWVDIGTSEPLLLDILINAMAQISSDHVGIKQMVFGGSEYENSPNLTSADEAPIHDQDWVTSSLADVKPMKERYPAFDRISAVLTTICEVKNHPVKPQPSEDSGSVILAKEPVLQASFARAVASLSKAQAKKEACFLPNPKRHCCPKLRVWAYYY